MNYIFVFFLIFSLAVGFVTYGLSIAFLIRKKTLLTLYYFIFLTFFLIIILIASLSFFLELFINIPQKMDFIFSILAQISALALNFVIIIFIYDFLQLTKNKKTYAITFIILVFLFISIFLFYLYSYINEPYNSKVKTFNISDIFIFLFPLYPISLFFIYYKKAKKPIIAKIVRMIIIFYIPFLPILLLENLNINFNIELWNLSVIHFRLLTFPIYYLLFNFILLYYGFKYFHTINNIQPENLIISDAFIKKYNISNREKEIIQLIYEAYNNKQISNRLFISPATVRNHIHNIYEKTGASNRVELIRFCKE